MDHPWMERVAAGLTAAGVRVIRFEFPYMAKRRETGKHGGPNPVKTLLATWNGVIEQIGDPQTLVIGGKSMGGRIASMVADANGVRGVVCLGYPFHPAGKPDQLRTEHLSNLRTQTLIVQGERDAFGSRSEVGGYELSERIRLHWLPDGDHSFKPRRVSGRSEAQNIDEAVAVVADFLGSH